MKLTMISRQAVSELAHHILFGLATTALVAVATGAYSKVLPPTEMAEAAPVHAMKQSTIEYQLAPQCRAIVHDAKDFPRCQEQAKEHLH